jgi:hypothetical protein
MKSLYLGLIASVLLAAPAAHAQEVVTGCGDTVIDGVLAADLDCSAQPSGCAVSVLDRGSLDLAGFTITAGPGCGIGCEDDCSIDGGGGTLVAVDSQRGITAEGHNSRVNASNLNIVGGNFGILAARVTLIDSTVTLANTAVTGMRSLEVRGSEITDSIVSLISRRHLTIADTTITGNVHGADAWRKVEALNVTATDNDTYGLRGRKVQATTTTATGNGNDPSCDLPYISCGDVVSRQTPKLSGVTCETSAKLDRDLNEMEGNWGVCGLD